MGKKSKNHHSNDDNLAHNSDPNKQNSKRKFSASDAFDSAFDAKKDGGRSFTSSQATNLSKPKQVTKIVLPPKDKRSEKMSGSEKMTPTPSEISHKNDLSLDDPFAEPYLDES